MLPRTAWVSICNVRVLLRVSLHRITSPVLSFDFKYIKAEEHRVLWMHVRFERSKPHKRLLREYLEAQLQKNSFLLFSHIWEWREGLRNGACCGHWKGWLSFMFINLNICNKVENTLNPPGSWGSLFRQIMTIFELRSSFPRNHVHCRQGSYSEALGLGFLVSKLTHAIFVLQKGAPYMAHGWLF